MTYLLSSFEPQPQVAECDRDKELKREYIPKIVYPICSEGFFRKFSKSKLYEVGHSVLYLGDGHG